MDSIRRRHPLEFGRMTSKQRLLSVLRGETPDRIPFAPNIWQWFEYQKLHGLLPLELKNCQSQLEVLRLLGVDIFSRNLLTDIRTRWFGAHAGTVFPGVEKRETRIGNQIRIEYETKAGRISEALEFQEDGCTLVQLEYLFKDFETEYRSWLALFEALELTWLDESYRRLESQVGDGGLVIAGEITSPLKQLHMLARADQTTFLLFDHEPEMMAIMDLYADKALRLIAEMARQGVPVVMSMDNLDSTFYPPPYFNRYCRGFFTKAAEICHRRGARFFSHACGQQREILPLVVESGIDGLEGIAFPPLGDIELWEAQEVSPRFIVQGGLSALQLEGEVSQAEAERYVERLFGRMKPQQFIFSMSCNTSIRTSWETLVRYRDAWMKYSAR